MKFSNLTVVGVTGTDVYTEGLYRSIAHSARLLEGSKAVLFSPSPPQAIDPAVELRHVPVAPFGYLEYSLFCLYCLADFVATSHCLLVQHDGWAIDAANWDDAFWQYDYIGAPSPVVLVETPEGPQFSGGYDWERRDPATVKAVVQNGGFSLRSKRILDLPRRLSLNQIVNPPGLAGSPGTALAMRWPLFFGAEDFQLTAFWREPLIAHGVKFAPLDVARRFSYEHAGDHTHDDFDFARLFGHHSKYRVLEAGEPPSCVYQMSERQLGDMLKNPGRELDFIVMLRAKGYRVRFRDP